MQKSTSAQKQSLWERRPHRAAFLLTLFLVELSSLVVVHQFFVSFECGDTDAFGTCRFLRSLVARALVICAAFGILYWAKPKAFTGFISASALHSGRNWMVLHVVGLALIWTPLLLTGGHNLATDFHIWWIVWALGSALAAIGGLFWLAAPKDWRLLIAQDRYLPVLVLTVAAIVPDVADMMLPVWDLSLITEATFAAVYQLLRLFSATTFADPTAYIIGVEAFAVHIARQCSGVEGMALVSAFVLFYGLLFRKDLHLGRYWLTVLPLGILFSVLLNVVRITVLILIGAHISPDLAVNGFHSYAGWLFFTLLALGLVYIVQKVRWLHRDPTGHLNAPPVISDPVAAQILPFVVFMFAGILTQALFTEAALGYPLIVLGLAGSVWIFRDYIRALPWGLDPVGIGAGLAIGLIWVLMAERGSEAGAGISDALATLAPAMLIGWIVLRLVGTILLVPLVEELFFRGYVMARLDRGGLVWRLVAVAVSTLLFAALHGRWLAAGLAGLVFALVMLRRGRVSDAVQSHMAANALVAAAALAMRDFSLI